MLTDRDSDTPVVLILPRTVAKGAAYRFAPGFLGPRPAVAFHDAADALDFNLNPARWPTVRPELRREEGL